MEFRNIIDIVKEKQEQKAYVQRHKLFSNRLEEIETEKYATYNYRHFKNKKNNTVMHYRKIYNNESCFIAIEMDNNNTLLKYIYGNKDKNNLEIIEECYDPNSDNVLSYNVFGNSGKKFYKNQFDINSDLENSENSEQIKLVQGKIEQISEVFKDRFLISKAIFRE